MKILFINSVCGIGSTGRICTDLAQKLEAEGHNVKIAYGRGIVCEQYKKYSIRIGNELDWRLHALQTRLFDIHGFCSVGATRQFLEWADEFNPDVLWLHNIHGYYINIELLFEWIKNKPEMDVRWTLHDCWAFTGHCSYFSSVKCEQWKKQCKNCVQKYTYPKSIFYSNVKNNYERKRKAFLGVKNLILYCPSKWLAELVSKSFLKEYPIEVHCNKIDKNIFKPVESNFREIHNIKNKFIVLGVANVWDRRRGLADFYALANVLDERFVIVLVGLEKKQIYNLPKNIIGIPRTDTVMELVKIYTAADVFVNPSKEESFGMTTVEALACGTTAIVYKDTACAEIAENNNGIIVEQGFLNIYRKLQDLIVNINKNN